MENVTFFDKIGKVSSELTLISRISIFLKFNKYVNQYISNLAMLFVCGDHLYSNIFLT